jgi:hypothetical protein
MKLSAVSFQRTSKTSGWPLSFRAQRGISLCLGVDRGTTNQSKIPRCARNDTVT